MENLFSLLGHRGRIVNDPLIYGSECHRVPFSYEQIVGIIVYSITSYAKTENYYTDRKEIFYLKHQELDEIQSHMEDAARQDVTLELIDLTPVIPDSYELCDGHLMLKDFSSSFKGRSDAPYFKWLREISTQIPYELLQEFERKAVKRRISRWNNELKELLTALRADKFTFTDSLEERLFG